MRLARGTARGEGLSRFLRESALTGAVFGPAPVSRASRAATSSGSRVTCAGWGRSALSSHSGRRANSQRSACWGRTIRP
jgi:hypothetical protein